MNLRRTDGEALNRSVPADEISRPDEPEPPVESGLSMDRDKCVPIIRGLVALILSVDFTCHVDLFIVACKVRHFAPIESASANLYYKQICHP